MTTESPETLTKRICEAISTKLAGNEKCLKLIQFDVHWLLAEVEWRREAAEAKLAAAREMESVETDQPKQGDMFGDAA